MVIVKNLSEKDIPKIISLSRNIFHSQENEENHYHDQQVWVDHFQQNGLLFGAYVDNTLVGYVFFYERDKGTKSLHCWMAGVSEKYRGRGIFKTLMENAEGWLKDNSYQQMTINTYPDKFPVMYQYLIGHGYHMYREELKPANGTLTKKCYFRKELTHNHL